MTTSELIKELQNLPPDSLVCLRSPHHNTVYKLYLKPVCYVCPCRYEQVITNTSETSQLKSTDVTLTDVTAVSISECNCVILNTH
jgi:hypothetical protein